MPILRSTVDRPVCLGIKHQFGLTIRFLLLSDSYGFVDVGRSLTKGRVCRLKLPLVLASADIFGSDSHGTRDHNLLSQIRDFPFRRLLRPAGSRPLLYLPGGWSRSHHVEQFLCFVVTGILCLATCDVGNDSFVALWLWTTHV
jgi:hypothetical protein